MDVKDAVAGELAAVRAVAASWLSLKHRVYVRIKRAKSDRVVCLIVESGPGSPVLRGVSCYNLRVFPGKKERNGACHLLAAT